MASRLTGEEFTYTFKSEITDLQLDGYEKLQERMNHAAMEFEGYLGRILASPPVYQATDSAVLQELHLLVSNFV